VVQYHNGCRAPAPRILKGGIALIHSKKQTAVVLLTLALALAGCGGQKQGASGSVSTGENTETEAASGEGASGGTDSQEGKRVYGNKKMYIYLMSMETTEDEGTAV